MMAMLARDDEQKEARLRGHLFFIEQAGTTPAKSYLILPSL
jgi:hypothetical protein